MDGLGEVKCYSLWLPFLLGYKWNGFPLQKEHTDAAAVGWRPSLVGRRPSLVVGWRPSLVVGWRVCLVGWRGWSTVNDGAC